MASLVLYGGKTLVSASLSRFAFRILNWKTGIETKFQFDRSKLYNYKSSKRQIRTLVCSNQTAIG